VDSDDIEDQGIACGLDLEGLGILVAEFDLVIGIRPPGSMTTKSRGCSPIDFIDMKGQLFSMGENEKLVSFGSPIRPKGVADYAGPRRVMSGFR